MIDLSRLWSEPRGLFVIGDVFERLKELPDGSVDLVFTSPPFLNLRSYLPADDPNKGKEIGGEPTPEAFIDTMLDVLEEVGRVLAPHGSACFEFGDTYSGCVDDATEALTQRGWLSYDKLQVGDTILTLNPTSRLAEWGTVEKVNVHPVASRRMLAIEGRGHSSLTTADHRWYVERRQFIDGIGQRRPGERNGFASLTRRQVEEIQRRYKRGATRQVDLAAEYGVTQSAISKIATGRTWAKAEGMSGIRTWVKRVEASETLCGEDRVPTAAPIVNLPTDAKWSDALVEAVAWYWTEGNDRTAYGKARGLWIVQSVTANPDKCDRIRSCLTTLFGPPVDRLQGRSRWSPIDPHPQWREQSPRVDGQIAWKLNGAAADIIRPHAPDKVVSAEWLTQLTQAQIDLFIEVSIAADGHRRATGEMVLAQSDRRRAEAFQMACVLSGRAASITYDEVDYPQAATRAIKSGPRWVVQVRRNRWFKPLRHPHRWVEHDGIVWCPTTNNGSWLARRNGQVFFTGNSGGAGGDYNEGGLREGQLKWSGSAAKRARHGVGGDYRPPRSGRDKSDWPDDKSLCLIPESFRWACSYGRNPFNDRVTPRWMVRNVVRWWRPNPPVGDLGDKFRPATSDIAVLTKSKTRYFDQDAVRVVNERQNERYVGRRRSHAGDANRPDEGASPQNPAGAPLQDTWIVPTKSYKGSHYAVFPSELVTPFVLSMCPQRVCIMCGEPSRRITKKTPEYEEFLNGKVVERAENPQGSGTVLEPVGERKNRIVGTARRDAEYTTVGWTECECSLSDKWRPGIVLDPFVGSGTTLAVATGCTRSAVGIDLDRRNIDLARDRVGMFLIEEE